MRSAFLSRIGPVLLGVALIAADAMVPLAAVPASASADPLAASDVMDRLRGVVAPFVENAGQYDDDVRFGLSIGDGNAFLVDGGVRYAFPDASVRKTFVGGQGVRPRGSVPAETVVNMLVGQESEWKTDLPTFNAATYDRVWHSVSVDVTATAEAVEEIYHVLPGGDPSDIAVRVEGAGDLAIDEQGRLVVGHALQSAPVARQTIGGEDVPVRVSYRLIDDRTYGFETGDYDPAEELTIDPLIGATFFGGDGMTNEQVDVAQDASGNIYVSSLGSATSGGQRDVVIGKFDPTLSTLLSSTYFGSSVAEQYARIAIGKNGWVYVTGQIGSDPGLSFPLAGCELFCDPASGRWFIAALSPDLTSLQGVTMSPSSGQGGIFDIAADKDGNIFIVGGATALALSGNPAYDTVFGGGTSDAFVAKLEFDLTELLGATFVGGGGTDLALNLAMGHDAQKSVYVFGSAGPGFPVQIPSGGSVYDSTHNGGDDLFVLNIKNDLSALNRSTFIGTAGGDNQMTAPGFMANAFAIDAADNVYISVHGTTALPITTGPARMGAFDIWVGRLNSALDTLGARFLNAPSPQFPSISVSPQGIMYVAFHSANADNFGSFNAFHPHKAVGYTPNDGVLVRLAQDFRYYVRSYLQGEVNRSPVPLVALNGNVFVAGTTSDCKYPTALNAPSGTYRAPATTFVSLFDSAIKQGGRRRQCNNNVDLTASLSHVGDFIVGEQGDYTVTVHNDGTAATPTSQVITLYMRLPKDMAFVSHTGAGWSCSIWMASVPSRGQVVECTLSTTTHPIAARSSAAPLAIRVNVTGVSRVVDNYAVISYGYPEERDNHYNNEIWDSTRVLGGSGGAGSMSIKLYPINLGTGTAEDIVVKLLLPSRNFRFRSAKKAGVTTDICEQVGQTVVCDYSTTVVGGVRQRLANPPTLGNNSSTYHTLANRLEVTFDSVSCGTDLRIAATISGRRPDRNPANNVSSVIPLPGTPCLSVGSITVDDGNVQRSMVDSLTLNLSTPITQAAFADILPFMQMRELGGSAGPIVLSGSVVVPGGQASGNQVRLEFLGPPIIGGSLPDGRFRLEIGNTLIVGPETIWRFFADVDGDGDADSADQDTMNAIPNGARRGFSPLYSEYHDYNGNGVVSTDDRDQFNRRTQQNIVLPPEGL